MNGVVSWIATWIIVILAMIWLSGTRWGRPIVYYLLWLAVVILIVGNANELTRAFNASALNLNG